MFGIQNRRYLGNKHKLVGFIEAALREHCPDTRTFFDVFAGTGVVGYHFMDRMRVVMNDTLHCNHLAHVAFLSGERVDLQALRDIIAAYNALSPKRLEDNYMSVNFADTYFSRDDCRLIGHVREDIEKLHGEGRIGRREKAILVTSLLYAMDRIANTCGHYDSYRRGVKHEKHLMLDMLDLSRRPCREPLFFARDANELVSSKDLPFVDCAYCDPPYNSRNYCDLYHVLENVAVWSKPEVFGVARKMDRTSKKSRYCSRKAADAFRQLVENVRCRYVVLSYNNTGKSAVDRSNARMCDDDIMDILSSRGKVLVCSTRYRAFTAGKSENSKNEERLFICRIAQ